MKARLGSSSVVVLGLLAGAGLVSALSGAARAAAAQAPEERLAADSSLVMGIDVAAIRTTGLVDIRALISGADDDIRGPFDLLRKAGLHVERDLDRVALGSVPAAQGSGSATKVGSHDFVLVATGRFDAAALRSALVAQGAEVTKLGAFEALRLPSGGATAPAAYLSFVGADSLVIGGEEASRGVHARSTGASHTSAPLVERVRKQAGTTPLVWLGLDGNGEFAKRSGTPASFDFVSLWASGDADGIVLNGVADTANPQAAMMLSAVVQLGLGLALSPSGATSGVKPRLEMDGNRLAARLALTRAQLAALANGKVSTAPQ